MGSDKEDYILGISILEQALANLTAVVTASALDIRALDSNDKANEPFPYDLDWLTLWQETIEAGADGFNNWDQTDDAWVSGEDFYVRLLMLFIETDAVALTTNVFTRYWQGWQLYLKDGTTGTKWFYYKSEKGKWYHQGTGVGKWFYAETYIFPSMVRIDDGGAIQAYIENYTNHKFQNVYLRIGGISQ